jgi:Flp pilus assembly protein CpaB
MMLRYINVPAELVSRDMSTSLNTIAEHECRTFLAAGEPIRKSYLFSHADGIAANLTSDERAITLQLNEDELLDHALIPDDLVDVIAVSNKDGKRYAKTICQKARVLIAASKAQILARHVGGASNKVTLAVSPAMAELVSEAADEGKIRLVLRGRYNRFEEVLSGAGPNELLPASVVEEAAMKEAEIKAAKDKAADKAQQSALLAAEPKFIRLPPPPPAPSQTDDLPKPPPKPPFEWVVQMFSGNKKEQVSVPTN